MAAPAPVAEPDIVRRSKAAGAGCVEARRAAVVHRARPAADVVDPLVAVRDHRVLRGARGERVDRGTDEGELSVGGREPVHHLVVGHEVRRGLGLQAR